jgi:3-dehydroquinate synthase
MEISNYRSEIFYSDNLHEDLKTVIERHREGKVFLATETRVNNLWLQGNDTFQHIAKIVLPAGEENKKISSAALVWEFLSNSGADRKSLLINVGGGMLTDLAGFAASTFKRGIGFINIPTTLLSQVDASVGGKTGINFNGLKNEIGSFQEPEAVIIYTPFLQTLDRYNLLSGFAEMIKHGLIHNPDHLRELMDFDLVNIDYSKLQECIRHSVEVKKYFVMHDPHEKNIRKALNFGHTVGHAIESHMLEQNRPVLHGYAVAWGMIAELFLSSEICNLPMQDSERICQFISKLFGKPALVSEDFSRLIGWMQHDKKNESDLINFTLLPAIGQIEINRNCRKETILESLKYLQNL